MKKLYKKGTVHPTPPLFTDQLLSFLPATILTLTAALLPEDREVLAYLISCSDNQSKNSQKTTSTSVRADHRPSFNCYCFRCYMSYWGRWDCSPNRQLIHEIIDAFEEGLQMKKGKEKSRRVRRKSRRNDDHISEVSEVSLSKDESNSTAESGVSGGTQDKETAEEEREKGSARGFLNFLRERFWGVWI